MPKNSFVNKNLFKKFDRVKKNYNTNKESRAYLTIKADNAKKFSLSEISELTDVEKFIYKVNYLDMKECTESKYF